ncbi:unnamed protein product [Mytilus coruscus]|uniref:C2H2-type domain-containing protein n=1 Tax=Mytilus coruscus TaxID=42192 RepID=A0A6J8ASZ2_MYTCO|nr:unnamed protein product [Mytilus coruscus]
MPPKKRRAAKSSLNYDSLIHYLKYEAYPPEVNSDREKRNIRKRAKSFRLEQLPSGDKLYFIYTYSDEENTQHTKEVIYKIEDQQRAFDEFHINSKGVHIGREKLLTLITEKYYWQGICIKIREFLRACKECHQKVEAQVTKKKLMEENIQTEGYVAVKIEDDQDDEEVMEAEDLSGVSLSDIWTSSEQQSLQSQHFWDIVEVKILGPYLCNGRKKHVMVFMDVFSLWPEAAIVETMSSTVVTHVLINLICRFGVMNKLFMGADQTDTNVLMLPRTDILLASDIDIKILHRATPQTAEAWYEIEETMNQFVVNNSDWTNCLPFALLPHRISRGRHTEYSPAYLTYSRELNLPTLLTHQPTAEYLQTSDGYIPIDKKLQTLSSLMTIYKGYCGDENVSQDSDVFKGPLITMPRKKVPSGSAKTMTASSSLSSQEVSPSTSAQISHEGIDSFGMPDEDDKSTDNKNVKPKVENKEEQETSVNPPLRRKRWSKTHRTSMDNSSNNSDDLSMEEMQSYEKLLKGDETTTADKLMVSGEVDAYYDDVILYLKHKRYGVGVVNDHMKRNIRKMSESHYLEGDMLYHKWKTTSRIIPLRFDERYYIMENYHIDNKGRHLGFRQMYEKLNKFHWKSMAVDCEAYVRTCVTCNQMKSVNNESLFEYFYDITDEERAKLAEENYSLLVKYLQKGKNLQSVQPNKARLITLLANWFVINNGQLYYKRPDRDFNVCLEIAARAKKNAIRNAHFIAERGNHLNQSDTLQMLSEGYMWNGMKENCEDFVHSCCKHSKPANIKRNAAFKKFDLLQRVSLFKKIRVMQDDPKMTQKTKQHKSIALYRYQNILDDTAQDSFRTDIDQTEVSSEFVEMTENDQPHYQQENKMESENSGLCENTDAEMSVTNEIIKKDEEVGEQDEISRNTPSSSQEEQTMICNSSGVIEQHVDDIEEIINSKHQTEQDINQQTVLHEQAKSHTASLHTNSSEEMENEQLVDMTLKTADSSQEDVIKQEHRYTSSRMVDTRESRMIPLEEALLLCSSDNNLHGSGVIQIDKHEKHDTAVDNKMVESRPTQTEYLRSVSDEVTLSAIRSILPSDEHDEAEGELYDEETESENEEMTATAENDSDWKPKEVKSNQQDTSAKVRSKDPDLDPIKKKYDTTTRFRCKECGKCIRGIIRYRTHVYEHTGIKPFECEHCDKRFTTLKTKKIHMMRHTGGQQFLCYLCGKGFSTSISLKSHINIHEKGGNIMVKCELCRRVFRTKNRYEKHMQCKHPYTPETFRCDECDKDFTTRRSLYRHNKSQHEKIKTHICEICGKGFYRKEYLKRHLETHESVRPEHLHRRRPITDLIQETGVKYEIPISQTEVHIPRRCTIDLIQESGVKYEIPMSQNEVHIPNTVQYTNSETVMESITVPGEYTIPLSDSTHIALPSTTVENQMTVESSYYISNPDDENQVSHMFVYEQPAVQYEVECGSSEEQIDAAEALTAINMLAQASINQGF